MVERMPEVGDKQVSKSTVATGFVQANTNGARLDLKTPEGQKKGILYDPDLEAALEDW